MECLLRGGTMRSLPYGHARLRAGMIVRGRCGAMSRCSSCKLGLPAIQLMGMVMSNDESEFHELCHYTLALGDPSFIHQHVVDAFAAQHAQEGDKPIKLAFALAGLYLHVERGFSGREVQLAHMKMGRRKHAWPVFSLPVDRGSVTVSDVVALPAGPGRDGMIHQWCVSVWGAYAESRVTVIDLVDRLL